MTYRAAFSLVFLIAFLMPSAFAVAQTPAPATLLDLPAAILTPGDAAAMGLPGFGRFGNGNQRQLDEYAQQRATFQGKPFDEVVTTLTDAGWLQGYSSQIGLPDQPGAQNAQPTQVLFSSIYQYATSAGASGALAYITDYSGVTGATVDTSVDGPTIGDASVWSRTTSATLDEQRPSDEVAVVFQVGDLFGAVGSIDYEVTSEDVATPTAVDPERVSKVAELATAVQAHLAAIADAPGLSRLVTRLGSDSVMPTITDEGYRRLNGSDIPYFNGYEDGFPGAATTATDAYEYTAALGQEGGDPYEPYFALRVLQFPDEASASSYLTQFLAASAIEGSPVAGGSSIGDESILIQDSFELGPGVTVQRFQSLARVGDRVSLVSFESGDHVPDPNVVIGLAQAQATCLKNGVCDVQPIPTDW
jgi:hypothetical protein